MLDHLTSFALLLNGIDGKEAACDSNSGDYTLAWISMALIIAAILIIFVAVVGIEVRYRFLAYKIECRLRMIERQSAAASQPSFQAPIL